MFWPTNPEPAGKRRENFNFIYRINEKTMNGQWNAEDMSSKLLLSPSSSSSSSSSRRARTLSGNSSTNVTVNNNNNGEKKRNSRKPIPRPHETEEEAILRRFHDAQRMAQELGRDIRLTYAGSRTSAERLKMGIIQARMLVRDCLLETEINLRQ
ncbi:Similar to Cdk2ap2: Cyclin-dependent kinase 2-associated protein 2 (Mus musculus) [Cotesia congregata]|uniref:Similar to Cdk2ap2: Cyclin-dependent kinase 2-associated protein 2 (Mus musculus) n=1 Tax=Cotesia congregata TaxID=51543 RepID=A0A8J2HDB4_COTCN|nr:Similar to Cdk2ap2: Cyclin-dependent kinase 2-associated protein 2 (Mus musculus) [Cotesia congregata]